MKNGLFTERDFQNTKCRLAVDVALDGFLNIQTFELMYIALDMSIEAFCSWAGVSEAALHVWTTQQPPPLAVFTGMYAMMHARLAQDGIEVPTVQNLFFALQAAHDKQKAEAASAPVAADVPIQFTSNDRPKA